MSATPEPEVSYRSWTFTYRRPRRLGWPVIETTDLKPAEPKDDYVGYAGKKGVPVAVKVIRVHVRQHGTGQPAELSSISSDGTWVPSGNPFTNRKIHYDAPPGQALISYAPDWVMELVADAVDRANLEVAAAEEAK